MFRSNSKCRDGSQRTCDFYWVRSGPRLSIQESGVIDAELVILHDARNRVCIFDGVRNRVRVKLLLEKVLRGLQ